jgi:hypothetical protein
MLANLPQIAQRQQRVRPEGVPGQSTISNFGEYKLAFDDPKGMLDLGPNACLDFLGHVSKLPRDSFQIEHPSRGRHHRDL